MLSASSITNRFCGSVLVMLLATSTVLSQENSPYSRYGLGDLYPHQHIASRGMGGVSAAYLDGQAINSVNPASYGTIRFVTYDLGISIDARTLKRKDPIASYRSTNFIPSYVLLGIPLTKRKDLGVVLGLKPITRINYNVLTSQRTAIDSIITINEGSGGLNQFFGGLGKRWKNFSVGFNTGYLFGRKEVSTRTELINDTVAYRYGDKRTITSFNSLFVEGGVQWTINLSKTKDTKTNTTKYYNIRLGAVGALKQKLKADQDLRTLTYDETGLQDSVSYTSGIKGDIQLPSRFTFGFMLNHAIGDAQATVDRWSIGADLTMQKWGSDYKFYGQTDPLVNTTILNVGAQYTPNALSSENYWSRVTYRAGFFTGKDHINADGKELKTFAATFGLALPVRKWRAYDNQFSLINTALEIGQRGSRVNNITENYFKLSVGLSLSDIWFIPRKYD